MRHININKRTTTTRNFLTVVAPLSIMMLALRPLVWDVQGCLLVKAADTNCVTARWIHRLRGGSTSSPSSSSGNSNNKKKLYRTLQVQIVHRHGDRTPITPLRDESYWANTLIPESVLEKISTNTQVITNEGEVNTHVANGRGPFGKLTQLGLLQLVDLGTRLREELASDNHHEDLNAYQTDSEFNHHRSFRFPWHSKRPLHPNNIKILSTNFPRTIQSVQGLLVGLFPDGLAEDVSIDARHTEILIPDPQPRRTPEQTALETQLAQQPHLKLKEAEMIPLAIRVTEALMDSLGEGALGASFGVGEDASDNDNRPRLAWSQLAEITKCLQVRDKLPPTISVEDQETISKHTAWRWFESLRHPRLAYLAMNPLLSRIVDHMHRHHEEPPVIIYSAHDSTLIGLLCGFRLEQPSVWPEYASFLKLELLEVVHEDDTEEPEHVVRFSLNGSLLRSIWDSDQEPLHEIPLRELAHKIKTVGAVKAQYRDSVTLIPIENCYGMLLHNPTKNK